jgi:hypothetical protein
LAAILFLKISASLDCFDIKNILFMTLFFIKRSRLATGQKSPDFKWSGFQMPGTGIRSNPNTDHGSVFGGSLYLSGQTHMRFILFLGMTPRTSGRIPV